MGLRWGSGFMLSSVRRPMLGEGSFGHDGAGGHLAFGHLEAQVGSATRPCAPVECPTTGPTSSAGPCGPACEHRRGSHRAAVDHVRLPSRRVPVRGHRAPLWSVRRGVRWRPPAALLPAVRRADAGFDPEDHGEVDARLGTWRTCGNCRRRTGVMSDVIVNHVSAQSPQFQDVRRRGDASPWRGMFLTMGSVFPDGATEKTSPTSSGEDLACPSPRWTWAAGDTWSGRRSRPRRSTSTSVRRRRGRTSSASSTGSPTPVSPCCGSTPRATWGKRQAPPAF